MNIEDILFDDASMSERLSYATRNDIKLTSEQAHELVQIMRMRNTSKLSGRSSKVITFKEIPIADRSALVIQFFINLSQAGHTHSPIADNLVALSFGFNDLRTLINAIKPEFCDSHSSDPREITKCIDTWGIPTPAQFLFGRGYNGISIVTGGTTNDIRRLMAQEMTLIEPEKINAAIFTDSVLPYTLENYETPPHLNQINPSPLDTYIFYTIQSANNSDIDLSSYSSIIWDSTIPMPDSIIKSRSQALVIITESVSALDSISPDYLIVTEPDKLTEALIYEKFPVLKRNKAKYFAQQYKGDAIFHITHISGSPQRTIGYPWFPERTKTQSSTVKHSFLSRIFSRGNA